jgi:hypothetical protein
MGLNLLESKGVQMMLGSIVKSAAPELVEKVQEFSAIFLAFKEQMDRVEATQRQILGELNELGSGNQSTPRIHGANGRGVENADGPGADGGKQAGE